MVVRFHPAASIFDEIDTILNSAIVPGRMGRYTDRVNRSAVLSVKDTGEQMQVYLEIPGVEKQDVSVNVNNDVLTIAGERKQPVKKENEQWIRNEITYGKFERTIPLPYSVDVEKVSASVQDGILTVILPKHENAKPKQISIR
jgi:HSP20 family protein